MRIWTTVVGVAALLGAVIALVALPDPKGILAASGFLLVVAACAFLRKVTRGVEPAIGTSDAPPSDPFGGGPL